MSYKPFISTLMNATLNEWAVKWYFLIYNSVKDNLSGKVLKPRTYNLRDSVGTFSRLVGSGFLIGTNVFYGIAWEFGFFVKGYTIKPKTKKVLRWTDASGKAVFAKRANILPHKVAARPFVGPEVVSRIPLMQTDLGTMMTKKLKTAGIQTINVNFAFGAKK